MGTTVPLRPSKSQYYLYSQVRARTNISIEHELAFIVSSSLDKPDLNARQLIRRHVMRGKNRRKRPADALIMRSWINQENSFYHQSNPEDAPSLCFPLPMQIGSSLSLSIFAYDMPPYALNLIFKCEFCISYHSEESIPYRYAGAEFERLTELN
jgi:hypothetical protein